MNTNCSYKHLMNSRLCITLLSIISLYHFNSLTWLTGHVEVVFPSTIVDSRRFYSMNNNDIIPFFTCFQLKSQINYQIKKTGPVICHRGCSYTLYKLFKGTVHYKEPLIIHGHSPDFRSWCALWYKLMKLCTQSP